MRKLYAPVALALVLLLCPARGQSQDCPSPIAYGQNTDAGHVALVNGIRMYYETYGRGPVLLLIHGNGGSIYGMRCQISYFSRSYRAIVADSRAHGKTEDGSGRLTYEQMADDLSALLSEAQVNSVDLIGQSDGGIIGLLLAIRHPSQVNKLVISSPNLRPDATALADWVIPLMKRDQEEAIAMSAKGDRSKD